MKSDFKLALVRMPVLGPVILFLARVRIVGLHFFRPLPRMIKWMFTAREVTNFTYDLTPDNQRYLASLLSEALRTDIEELMSYFHELEEDEALRRHIETATRESDLGFMADPEVRYARRIGWYAIARSIKPKLIVETGVDKGLGACILTAALLRNKEEGHSGRYVGTDINPRAGYLLAGAYREVGRVAYGDSIETLKTINGPIDLFINDSDHSAGYEAEEYRTIAEKLSENAVLLGDNAHITTRLLDFSLETCRRFLYFQEQPAEHWFSGAGIGVSFRRPAPAGDLSRNHHGSSENVGFSA